MYVCAQFWWRSWGKWVGTKPQDDRFTFLRTIDFPLCIALFPLPPNQLPSSAPFLSTFHIYPTFITLLSHVVILLFWKSVVSCLCHSFTLQCLLFFSVHLLTFCFSLCPHNIPKSLSPLCLPFFSALLCTVDRSLVWPVAFYNSGCFSVNQVLYFLCNIQHYFQLAYGMPVDTTEKQPVTIWIKIKLEIDAKWRPSITGFFFFIVLIK